MIIELTIPDQVYNEGPTYKKYFELMQAMVNRMAVSHFKYGNIKDNAALGEVHEMKCALQRISMYDPTSIDQEAIWDTRKKETSTGNVENLIDAANFLLIESAYPKHPKAHFRAQSAQESPGLTFA